MTRAHLSVALVCAACALAGTARAQTDQPPITPTAPPTTPATRPADTAPPPPQPPPPAPQPARDTEDPPPPPAVEVTATAEPEELGEQRGDDPEQPAVRAAAGNMGMFFRFGGLATMNTSNNQRKVNNLLLTQVGLKFVLDEHWMIPLVAGFGVRAIKEDTSGPFADSSDERADVGVELGSGFEYHFRIWRRISPFFGVNLGFGIFEPTGENNLTFGFYVGPSLGVEYYIADRVSLTAQYIFQFTVEHAGGDPDSVTAFQLTSMAGGAVNLTFYF